MTNPKQTPNLKSQTNLEFYIPILLLISSFIHENFRNPASGATKRTRHILPDKVHLDGGWHEAHDECIWDERHERQK
jgi:hypothetical protein